MVFRFWVLWQQKYAPPPARATNIRQAPRFSRQTTPINRYNLYLWSINCVKVQVRSVLFDFDGVIADTEPRYADFFRAELAGTGMDVEEFVRSVRGTPLKRMMEVWSNTSEHT